jgi:nucleotidyltransferase/DNA polymerase involved in DNA repair
VPQKSRATIGHFALARLTKIAPPWPTLTRCRRDPDADQELLERLEPRAYSGSYYYWISRGIDGRPVRAHRIRKFVGAENTFSQDLADYEALAAELQPLIHKVWRHCEAKGARGRRSR